MDFVFKKHFEIDLAEFDSFFALLKSGLLPLEYRSYQNQKKLLENESYNILFCKHDKNVIGAIAFWYVEDFVFVEHFVVKSECRNQGLGTKMLEVLSTKLDAKVILEVELPNSNINSRRIEFYKRNGFCYNDFEYFQPPLNEGDELLELKIMSKPCALSEEEFQEIRSRLIKAVYKQ